MNEVTIVNQIKIAISYKGYFYWQRVGIMNH